MGSIIYRAVDEQSKQKYGYCDAETNKEVLEILKNKNLTNIKLYGDAFVNPKRKDMASLNEVEMEKISKHELSMMLNPSFKTDFLFYVKDVKKLSVVFLGLIVLLFGVYNVSTWIVVIGCLILLSVPIVLWLTYLFSDNFRKLNKAYSYGRWNEVHSRLDYYRDHDEKLFPIEVKVHLDTIGAKLLAIESNSDEALKNVKDKYGFLHDISPIQYSLLLGYIYAINGDYNGCLNQVHKLYSSYPNIAILKLDMAVAEAYFGNKEKAKALLDGLIIEELDVFAIPLINCINGIIIKEKDNTKALEFFEKSLNEMEIFKNAIGIMDLFALTMGYYAVSLYDNNQEQEALSTLDTVWDILGIHGHKSLIEEIFKRMPKYKER